MIEIKELIIRGKVNGDFDSTSQDIAKIIDEKIDKKLSEYNAKLSKSERKNLINQCINELYEKVDFESRL
tara:strand:+ start:261 stop:470 length:210 start_codon:yes stop_codon:yes gene_type:complete